MHERIIIVTLCQSFYQSVVILSICRHSVNLSFSIGILKTADLLNGCCLEVNQKLIDQFFDCQPQRRNYFHKC